MVPFVNACSAAPQCGKARPSRSGWFVSGAYASGARRSLAKRKGLEGPVRRSLTAMVGGKAAGSRHYPAGKVRK